MKQIILLLCISSITFGSIEWDVIGKTLSNEIVTTITQTFEPGWYSYWKNPGDSGGKATISIKTPNVSDYGLIFPKPELLTSDFLVTYGYKNSVQYKLFLKTEEPVINAIFSWLECKDVCIPKEASISLNIPNRIPLYIKPKKPSTNITIKATNKSLKFIIPNSTSAEFYPYENGYLKPETQSFKRGTLTIRTTSNQPNSIKGELFIDENKDVIIIDSVPIKTTSFIKFFWIIISAFIGGLLLNIMPCVLPIIGIKALQMQKDSSNKLKDVISYQLGISSSILTLYLILVSLQKIGFTVGWGFQLQSPITIQILIVLFICLLLSTLDIIIIRLPSFIQNKSSSNMFWSGVLTTIVATPCTAPFLGTALAFALFQPIIIGLIIFISLSVGLGFPLILLTLNPFKKGIIPKSGSWNKSIKYSLSYGFILTIMWLCWILETQVSKSNLIIFLITTLLITSLIVMNNKSNLNIKKILPIILTIISIVVITLRSSPSEKWLKYEASLIKSYEKTNTAFFIDITARWCVTCQTNKITVLNKTKTIEYFNDKNITLVRADWTNYDESITSLLSNHNQVSIPTYIYYDGSNYSIISDIITFKDLKRMINQ